LTCTRRVVAPRITWRTGTEPPPPSLNSAELNLLKLNKTTVVKIRQEPKMIAIAIFTLVICGIGVESLPGLREKRHHSDFVTEAPKNCFFFIFGAGKTYEVVFHGKEQGYIGTSSPRTDWEDARWECQAKGGDLAQPSNRREQDKIVAALRKLPTNNMQCAQYYIGVKKEGSRAVPYWLSGQEMKSDSGLKFAEQNKWFRWECCSRYCGAISAGGKSTKEGGKYADFFPEGIKNVGCHDMKMIHGYICEYAANESPNCIP